MKQRILKLLAVLLKYICQNQSGAFHQESPGGGTLGRWDSENLVISASRMCTYHIRKILQVFMTQQSRWFTKVLPTKCQHIGQLASLPAPGPVKHTFNHCNQENAPCFKTKIVIKSYTRNPTNTSTKTPPASYPGALTLDLQRAHMAVSRETCCRTAHMAVVLDL